MDTLRLLNDLGEGSQGLDIRQYTQKITDELSKLEGACLNDYLCVAQDVD